MKGLIIQGSARNNGNTATVVNYLQDSLGFDRIDLNDLRIGHYDYDYQNQADDFLPLMRKIGAEYDILIFATPVYWYSMSGLMKVFFDRLTDCLKKEKPLGKQLIGKHMAMLSCGYHDGLPEGFTVPFESTAKYLGMHYMGGIHTWIANDKAGIEAVTKQRLNELIQKCNRL